jgi:transcriptional regulator with XRE-family HTH domain
LRAKKICIVCGKEFEPRVNNQKCCSPEGSDVQKVKRAKASYEKHKHQTKKKEKPKAKKEDLAKANEVARNSGMSYGQYMAEKYRAERLETIGERKVKKKESVFAGRLELALKEKDITQKELAIKIDVTPQTVNDYVVGRREPNTKTKLAIAQGLGVGIGYLLGRDSVGVDELLLMIDDKENSLSTPIERRLIYHTAKVVLQELILTYKEAQ